MGSGVLTLSSAVGGGSPIRGKAASRSETHADVGGFSAPPCICGIDAAPTRPAIIAWLAKRMRAITCAHANERQGTCAG